MPHHREQITHWQWNTKPLIAWWPINSVTLYPNWLIFMTSASCPFFKYTVPSYLWTLVLALSSLGTISSEVHMETSFFSNITYTTRYYFPTTLTTIFLNMYIPFFFTTFIIIEYSLIYLFIVLIVHLPIQNNNKCRNVLFV